MVRLGLRRARASSWRRRFVYQFNDEQHGTVEKDEHEEAVHAELHGEYHVRCEAPKKLERLTVQVFEHLIDAEELKVSVDTATVQSVAELTPRDTALKLAR